jgi:hypothetical protein
MVARQVKSLLKTISDMIPINCLKAYSLLFLLWAGIQAGYSQQALSISGRHEYGETVNRNDTFLLNDFCRFFIQDETENKKDLNYCQWRLECLDNDSVYIIDRETSNSNTFGFLLDDLHINPKLLKQIKAEDKSSILFQAKITCAGQTSSGEDFDLSFPVFLNLLPSVPVVNILEITGTSLPYYFSVKLNMYSNRADTFVCVVKEYDWPYTSILHIGVQDPSNFIFGYDADVDSTVISITTTNKFGSSHLERYKIPYLSTGLNEINNDTEASFYPNPFSNVLHIKGEYGNIEKLIIMDADGRTVRIINRIETPEIPVADLPQGMYIITIVQKQHSKNKSFKLVKR